MPSTTPVTSPCYTMLTSHSKHYGFLQSSVGHVKWRQKTADRYWLNFVVLTLRGKNKTTLLRDTVHQICLGKSAASIGERWSGVDKNYSVLIFLTNVPCVFIRTTAYDILRTTNEWLIVLTALSFHESWEFLLKISRYPTNNTDNVARRTHWLRCCLIFRNCNRKQEITLTT